MKYTRMHTCKIVWRKFNHSFCKIDHFTATETLFTTMKQSSLPKELISKLIYRIGSRKVLLHRTMESVVTTTPLPLFPKKYSKIFNTQTLI
jgi:hypothetical protein